MIYLSLKLSHFFFIATAGIFLEERRILNLNEKNCQQEFRERLKRWMKSNGRKITTAHNSLVPPWIDMCKKTQASPM
jgi:hypothetical protein